MICRGGRGGGLPKEAWCSNVAAEGDRWCPEHRGALDRVRAQLGRRDTRPAVKPKPPAAPKVSLAEGAAQIVALIVARGPMTRPAVAQALGLPETTVRHRADVALKDGRLHRDGLNLSTVRPVDALVAVLHEHGPQSKAQLAAALGGISEATVQARLKDARAEGLVKPQEGNGPARLVAERVAA